jgi:hypothetical protein
MNNNLKKEIINHIFNQFGLFQENQIYNLKDNKFLLDKKIIFEDDDKKVFESKIYASSVEIDKSNIKVIVADTSYIEKEYSVILRMDNFYPCGMRLSKDEDDFGTIMFQINNRWMQASTLLQSKILVGIESLSEIFLQWNKLNNYNEMYNILINFLNFSEKEV